MIIIFGLIILVAAVIVGVVGVLGNGGRGHALTHGFAVLRVSTAGAVPTRPELGVRQG